jgi:hypothetical protein
MKGASNFELRTANFERRSLLPLANHFFSEPNSWARRAPPPFEIRRSKFEV